MSPYHSASLRRGAAAAAAAAPCITLYRNDNGRTTATVHRAATLPSPQGAATLAAVPPGAATITAVPPGAEMVSRTLSNPVSRGVAMGGVDGKVCYGTNMNLHYTNLITELL